MAAKTPLSNNLSDRTTSASERERSPSKLSKLSSIFGGAAKDKNGDGESKRMSVSTGRGGAGNINPSSTPTAPDASSLNTPTIKQPQYTTGRGGTGNMAQNDPSVPAHAEMARAAQDVDQPTPQPPAARQVQQDGKAYVHHGRGGGGNLVAVKRQDSYEGRRSSGVLEGQDGGEVRGERRMGSKEREAEGERRRGLETGN